MSKEKIIVALDVETVGEAREIIAELRDHAGAFKIGLQLFTSAGASFVRETVSGGVKIFLDLKFHDIPNTVAKAAVEVARLGVWMFNVHAAGGSEMMRKTVETVNDVCEKEDLERPTIIGVTVLTSTDHGVLREIGVDRETRSQVLNLAQLTAKCGLDGVVASAEEARIIRENVPSENFLIVTPGIRPAFATNHDQKRVMTPKDALNAGSDYLVIGRPILGAENKQQALTEILKEIEAA